MYLLRHVALACALAAGASGTALAHAPIYNTAVMTTLSSSSFSTSDIKASTPNYTVNLAPVSPMYGTEGSIPYIDIPVSNTTTGSGAIVIPIGPEITLNDGTTSAYTLTTNLKLIPGNGGIVPPQAQVLLDLPANPAQTDIQAEQIADNSNTTMQYLRKEFFTGAKDLPSNATITKLSPVLTINVPAGTSFTVRVYAGTGYTTMTKSKATRTIVWGLDSTQIARPSGLVKLTAKLLLSGYDTSIASGTNNYEGVFELVNNITGAVTSLGVTPIAITKPAGNLTSQVNVPWQGLLSSSQAASDYQVRFRLRPAGQLKGVQLGVSDTSLAGEFTNATTGYTYGLGGLTVSSSGGMSIGASSGYYPYRYDDSNTKQDGTVLLGTSYGPKAIGFNMIRSDRKLPAWTATISNGTILNFDPAYYTPAYYDGSGVFQAPSMSRRQLTMGDWSNYFYSSTTPTKNKLLINLWGSPYEATSAPRDTNNVSNQGGINAPLSANGSTVFNSFLSQLLSTTSGYRSKIFALECSNEPNNRGFWSGTQTQLADACKAVWTARNNAGISGSTIPIICPQVDAPEKMGYMLSAKTSQNEPITNFCEMVGSHVYVGMGNDSSGRPYSVVSLAEQLRMIRLRMAQWNAQNKTLVITEYGISGPTANVAPYGMPSLTSGMTATQRADALYQSIATMQENGVKAMAMYGYDVPTPAKPNSPPPPPFGFMLNLNSGSPASFDATVTNRLIQAVSDIGVR